MFTFTAMMRAPDAQRRRRVQRGERAAINGTFDCRLLRWRLSLNTSSIIPLAFRACSPQQAFFAPFLCAMRGQQYSCFTIVSSLMRVSPLLLLYPCERRSVYAHDLCRVGEICAAYDTRDSF